MKTLPIELDDELCAFVCADSAKLGISESQYVSALLNDCMKEAREYEEARKAFFAIKPFNFEFIGGRRPTREELYDRGCLR